MSRPTSRFLELTLALVALVWLWPASARAQSCCAGSGALTPGRLTMHEDALLGLSVRAADAFGSLGGNGHYTPNPGGSTEYDFEQDLFGAVRFFHQGQAALLYPLIETRRATGTNRAELGGGIGDVNMSARWDFVAAGESATIPGIGVLVGLTVPTGTAPERARTALATGATGIGAFQGNVGLALEQSFGKWLVNATGLVAKRLPREVQTIRSTLGTQITTLGAAAYTFENNASLAGVLSYTFEGNATVAGHTVPNSGRRLFRASAAGSLPYSDRIRLQGSLYLDPPIPHVDQNQITTFGFTLAFLLTWT
jgi:hypothetical protein